MEMDINFIEGYDSEFSCRHSRTQKESIPVLAISSGSIQGTRALCKHAASISTVHDYNRLYSHMKASACGPFMYQWGNDVHSCMPTTYTSGIHQFHMSHLHVSIDIVLISQHRRHS